MYDDMSFKERNNKLKLMLEKHKIVIFPDGNI